MKNITTILLLLIAISPAFSQIAKGTSTVDGSISISRDKEEYNGDPTFYIDGVYKITSFSVAPGYGYFFANNFCIGANLSVSYSNTVLETKANPDKSTKNRSIGIGPFVRYYIPLDDKLYTYASAGCMPRWDHIVSDEPDGTSKNKTTQNASSFAWNAGIGLSYFITPSIAAEGGFAYVHDNSSDTLTKVALNIGFRIFLRKGE